MTPLLPADAVTPDAALPADAASPDAAPPDTTPFRIAFVCSGNICRSPMAEAVMRDSLARSGHANRVEVSSAGTGEWHIGQPADERALAALSRRGLDGSDHRARQFEQDWFDRLDLVVALDRTHERILTSLATNDDDRGKVRLLLSFDRDHIYDRDRGTAMDVPDPYYSDATMFDSVLETIVRATDVLAAQLKPALAATAEREATT